MKKLVMLIAFAVIFAACSSPKYSYYFDRYDYNSGKKLPAPTVTQNTVSSTQQSPLLISDATFTADASNEIMPTSVEKNSTLVLDRKAMQEKISSLDKSQLHQLKKELKSELKKQIKGTKKGESIKSAKASKVWDEDLKMAAIFGAIGVVLTILGGINTIFWVLGVIAFVIGVVFLIKWLARQ
jgi:hypothetical protein